MLQRVTKKRGNAEWHEYQCSGECGHGPLTGIKGATTIIGQKDKGWNFQQWLKKQGVLAAIASMDTLPTLLQTSTKDAVVAMLASAGDKTRDDKGNIGTRIHSGIEHWANKERISGCVRHDPPCSPDIDDIKPALSAFHRFSVAHKAEVVRSEFMVISHEHRYAATGDLAWKLWPCGDDCRHLPEDSAGDLRIDDVKTGFVADTVAFQLAAQRFADHDEYGDPPPQAKRLGVVSIRDDVLELIDFDVRPDAEFKAFLACRYLAEWDSTRAKHVMTRRAAA